VSVNGQQGHAQSCCNDLESLAYTIIFLARGDLPSTTNSIYNDRKAILQKMSIVAEELCEGLPPPFSKFISYVCSLGFEEKPDYQHLHSILSLCLEIDTDTNQPSKAPPSVHVHVSVERMPIVSGWV